MYISAVDTVHCAVGEAPLWDAQERALFLADLGNRQILRYDPIDGNLQRFDTLGAASALAIDLSGHAILAIDDTIYQFEFAIAVCSSFAMATGQPKNATFNDGRVDRQGRLAVGSRCVDLANPRPVGGIYRLSEAGFVDKLPGDISIPN